MVQKCQIISGFATTSISCRNRDGNQKIMGQKYKEKLNNYLMKMESLVNMIQKDPILVLVDKFLIKIGCCFL